MNQPGIKALFVDFNNTISPGNFQSAFDPFVERTGWTGKRLGEAYIGAGLLNRLMRGECSEPEFWIGVSDLTQVPLDILFEYADIIRETKELDHQLLDMLLACKRQNNLRLVLLTDNVPEMFTHWVEKFQLSSCFDSIINSADHGVTKREQRIYQIALERAQVRAAETLLVDDDSNYLQVAQSVGLQIHLFQGHDLLKQELVRRNFLFSD